MQIMQKGLAILFAAWQFGMQSADMEDVHIPTHHSYSNRHIHIFKAKWTENKVIITLS